MIPSFRMVLNELLFDLKAPDGYSISNNEDIPIVWICSYCRHSNNEIRRLQRQSKWDDFQYYVEWNSNNNPVGYAFEKDDIAMLNRFGLQQCDYCFRVRRWKHRSAIIEEMMSYALFYLFKLLLRLPLIIFYVFYRCLYQCSCIRTIWKRFEHNFLSTNLYEVIIELERKGLSLKQQQIMQDFFFNYKSKNNSRTLVKRNIRKAIAKLQTQRRAVIYTDRPRKCTEIAQSIRKTLTENASQKLDSCNALFSFTKHKSVPSQIIAK